MQISPVPRLLGHFPLTATVVLRALALHHLSASSGTRAAPAGQAASPLVRDTLAALFQRPFFAHGQPRLLQQVQHLFAFSAGYLRHSGAVGRRGEPLGEPRPQASLVPGGCRWGVPRRCQQLCRGQARAALLPRPL